jgi:hypothetical protein
LASRTFIFSAMLRNSRKDVNSPIEKHFFMPSTIFWGALKNDIGRHFSQLDGETPPMWSRRWRICGVVKAFTWMAILGLSLTLRRSRVHRTPCISDNSIDIEAGNSYFDIQSHFILDSWNTKLIRYFGRELHLIIPRYIEVLGSLRFGSCKSISWILSNGLRWKADSSNWFSNEHILHCWGCIPAWLRCHSNWRSILSRIEPVDPLASIMVTGSFQGMTRSARRGRRKNPY